MPFFLGCIAWNYSPALMGSLGPAMLRLLVMCGALLQVRFCCSLHSDEHGFNRQDSLIGAWHILTTAYCEANCATRLSPYAGVKHQCQVQHVEVQIVSKHMHQVQAYVHVQMCLMQVFSKGAKFSMFKPAEEMVYIGLDEESRTKGKAAIDVVGAQTGKSIGSVLQQALLLATGGVMAGAWKASVGAPPGAVPVGCVVCCPSAWCVAFWRRIGDPVPAELSANARRHHVSAAVARTLDAGASFHAFP